MVGGDEGDPAGQARRAAAPITGRPLCHQGQASCHLSGGTEIAHLLAVDLVTGDPARMPWGARSGEDVARGPVSVHHHPL